MGIIQTCIDHGVPREILISLLPADVSLKSEQKSDDSGKAPAFYSGGQWYNLPSWTRGESDERLWVSDQNGANAGLLLGCPSLSTDLQYLLLDLDLLGEHDLEPNPEAHSFSLDFRTQFLNTAWEMWRKDLLIRTTVNPRAALLVAIPAKEDPGGKRIVHLRHPDYQESLKPFGKIESLTCGQQACIAGQHHSGHQISWHRMSDLQAETGISYPAPPVSEGLPVFDSFQDLINNLTEVLTKIEQDHQVSFAYTGSKSSGSREGGRPPEARMPSRKSARDIVNFFNEAHHPATIERDQYITVLFAAAGCQDALRQQGRLNAEDSTAIDIAVANWAARYEPRPGGKPTTVETELTKYRNDICGRPFYNIGFDYLIQISDSLGVDLKYQESSQFFNSPAVQARVAPPTKTKFEHWDGSVAVQDLIEQDPTVEEMTLTPGQIDSFKKIADCPQSHVLISTNVQVMMRGHSIYRPEIKQWGFWNGPSGWRTGANVDSIVRNGVETLVVDYVARQGANWSIKDKTNATSFKNVNAIYNTLMSRLAISEDEINRSTFCLQTPVGAFELDTLVKIPLGRQMKMREFRCTAVTPAEGPTPIFDTLVLGVCGGDARSADWLLHYLGYSLIGNPAEHVFLVIWGTGGNGKSALLTLLTNLLGGYADALDRKVLLESGKDKHPTELNKIRHKRLMVVSELSTKDKWNESDLKSITGQDLIRARDLHKEGTSFRYKGTLLITTNDVPKFQSVGRSMARRLRVIGTALEPEPTKVILNIEDLILKQEGPAVLWKLMEYAQKVMLNGGKLPPTPPQMQIEANEILTENDQTWAWVQTCCVHGPVARGPLQPIEDLRASYDRFMNQGKRGLIDKIPEKAFTALIRKYGANSTDEHGNKLMQEGRECVTGLMLKTN